MRQQERESPNVSVIPGVKTETQRCGGGERWRHYAAAYLSDLGGKGVVNGALKSSKYFLDPQRWTPPAKGSLGIYTGKLSPKEENSKEKTVALSDDELLELIASFPLSCL